MSRINSQELNRNKNNFKIAVWENICGWNPASFDNPHIDCQFYSRRRNIDKTYFVRKQPALQGLSFLIDLEFFWIFIFQAGIYLWGDTWIKWGRTHVNSHSRIIKGRGINFRQRIIRLFTTNTFIHSLSWLLLVSISVNRWKWTNKAIPKIPEEQSFHES